MKHLEIIILGVVVLVALVGFFNLFTDNTDTHYFGGRNAQKAIYATSPQDFQPLMGGRGRRYIEDAASSPDFSPLMGTRGRRFVPDAG